MDKVKPRPDYKGGMRKDIYDFGKTKETGRLIMKFHKQTDDGEDTYKSVKVVKLHPN